MVAMKVTLPALTLLFVPAGALSIDYTQERTFEVSIESTITSETTHMSMEIDGEAMEGRGMGGGGSETTREISYTERVVEHEDGKPTTVKRTFDTIGGMASMLMGEESRDMDIESMMEGKTVIVRSDDGDIVTELEDEEADVESMLEGHQLVNLLDGLLPEDDSRQWEADLAALKSALLLDVERALYPRAPREEGGRGERGEGGGRGRGRGGRGGGGSALGFLNNAEGTVEASIAEETEEVDGIECIVIELSFEADGDLPEQERRGRGGFAWMELAPTERLLETTFEVEIEGKLFFSVEEKRPVALELEGEYMLDTQTERETGRGYMVMERTQEGTLEHTITITAEED